MVAGCGNKCVKYIFWAINFLFFLLGAAIVGLSLWLRFDNSFLAKVVSTVKIDVNSLPLESFYWLLYIVIGFGAVLLILGFLGCCGSACEVICAIGLMFSVKKKLCHSRRHHKSCYLGNLIVTHTKE
ncbi:hypothetical protein ANCCAN_16835 [Ancylostoma caninum]|uniref:Tetraspanin family protein n=1 Tax=Ancylostoma caninum TaxID=29170 RepID=A0A368G2K4_ANCCA|nr:hypothetical protein ANCCAN_16835 [Ancylostoma caninum]